MEADGTFFDAIVAFTTWPFGATDWFGALLRTAVVLAAYWIAWKILRWIYRKVSYKYFVLRYRRHCVHCNRWTLKRGDGEHGMCAPGVACCMACQFDHRVDGEPVRYCAHGADLIPMEKFDDLRLIRHVCPDCRSVTMSPGDCQSFIDYWYAQGLKKAEPSITDSFMQGLVIGGMFGLIVGDD